MRALKSFFLGRLLREKLMLVVFVALGAAMWLTSFSGRASRTWIEVRNTRTEQVTQAQWLDSRETIETAAEQAVRNLDPALTLDDTQLVGDLSLLAREHNLKFTNDTPQTERSAQFAVHSVLITLSRADWEVLNKFYHALSQRSPYIGITQFTLAADRTNSTLLTAQLRVSSVEIVR